MTIATDQENASVVFELMKTYLPTALKYPAERDRFYGGWRAKVIATDVKVAEVLIRKIQGYINKVGYGKLYDKNFPAIIVSFNRLGAPTAVQPMVQYDTSLAPREFRKTLNDTDKKIYSFLQAKRGVAMGRGDKSKVMEVTQVDVFMLFKKQNGRCAYTGIQLEWAVERKGEVNYRNASLDRIDSTKGYVHNNVHIVSVKANQDKRDMPHQAYIEKLKREPLVYPPRVN